MKCLAQEHNTMSPGRAKTRTARSGDERTNHEATALPQKIKEFVLILNSSKVNNLLREKRLQF